MKLNDDISLDFYTEEDINKDMLHDMSLKLISKEVKHNVWKVRYSYKTKRGNSRENYKYVIATDSTDAKIDFLNYINKFNKENEHRSLSNVKILEVTYNGQLIQKY